MLAAIGKVESDHGRVRLPGVRSGSNWAGACGPMQIGCVPGSKAGNGWARYGHGRPHDPANAIPAAARYLVDHGARRNLDQAIYAYNHSRAYVAKVKQLARRYAEGVGGGERPHRLAPGPRAGLDQAACSWPAVVAAGPSWPATPDQTVAARAAGRRRCPACGTRTARRLPGTTSPTSDLAVARGRRPLAPWRRQDLGRPIPARSHLAERR